MVSRRLGSIGPLARCVKDVTAVLDAIAGPCEFDPTTKAIPFSRMPNCMTCCQPSSLHGDRNGVPRNALRGHPPWAVLTGTVKEAFNKSLDVLRECGATIVENTGFTTFHEAILSKCPDVIKSSDFKLRLAQHCASLTVNPNNIRNMQNLVDHTQTDPREDYPSRNTRGLEKEAMAMDDQNCQDFKDTLAYMEYLANEGGVTGALQRNGLDVLFMPTCVAPIMPALGGFPMLSVPLRFYPEGTEIHWNVRHELFDKAPGLP